MPRRSGSRSSPSVARHSSPAPYHPPPAAPAHPPASSGQPSLLKQAAATAGGVAVGSVIGNTVGNALTGGSSASAAPAQQTAGANQQPNPCQYQIDQLVNCSVSQHDLTLCNSFVDVLKECRAKYGM